MHIPLNHENRDIRILASGPTLVISERKEGSRRGTRKGETRENIGGG